MAGSKVLSDVRRRGLLFLVYMMILPYPAVMKDWRARRAAAGT